MTDGSAASPPKLKPLAAAETAVRRLLLMIGFGFLAFVGGSIFSAAINRRLAERLEGGSDVVRILAWVVSSNLWVLLVLPAIGYLAGRFLEMKPWPTGIIGAGTGLTFNLALQYVSTGTDGFFADLRQPITQLVAAAGGVVLTALAIRRAREHARIAEEKAKVEAEKKKGQYDEFVKQAEALAERREQVPIAPAQPTAPAVEAQPGPTEPPPTGEPPKPT